MAVFDTLRAARTLKAAGFGDAQAEAVAEVIQGSANGDRVTKADLEPLATKAEVKSDLQELELRLTIRMGVMIATSSTIMTALIVGLIKLLP